MARGTSRAPSQNAYRGTVGSTRTQVVQVTAPGGDIVAAQVHVAVDATTDPELAVRLQTDEPDRALNAIAFADGTRSLVSVPVVYHDPAAEVFALVLGDGDRHRELDERARLYEQLAAERLAVPGYVRDFAVVFGGRGLRAYLEQRAEATLEKQRSGEGAAALEKLRTDLEREKASLDRRRAELERREAEIDRARLEIEKINREHERRRAELDIAGAELAQKLAMAARAP
ncbi:MAG TPA: hypothetical protein VL463_13105, partial [Kofleriaceae bacterium]|nr:hypothetical protein [Kofleriaceae bacterium]